MSESLRTSKYFVGQEVYDRVTHYISGGPYKCFTIKEVKNAYAYYITDGNNSYWVHEDDLISKLEIIEAML